MPNVVVDLLVAQGALNQALAGQSIGTDGCAVCVGLVAVRADRSKYCAHFDCNSQGITPEQRAAIRARTLEILQDPALAPAPVAVSACTTANQNGSTGAICAGIQAFFPGAVVYITEGIYAHAEGEIGTVAGNNQVLGENALLNAGASIII